MPPRTIDGIAELEALTGQPLNHSGWLEMTQEQVNLFADATLDHWWIHVLEPGALLGFSDSPQSPIAKEHA